MMEDKKILKVLENPLGDTYTDTKIPKRTTCWKCEGTEYTVYDLNTLYCLGCGEEWDIKYVPQKTEKLIKAITDDLTVDNINL